MTHMINIVEEYSDTFLQQNKTPKLKYAFYTNY